MSNDGSHDEASQQIDLDDLGDDEPLPRFDPVELNPDLEDDDDHDDHEDDEDDEDDED